MKSKSLAITAVVLAGLIGLTGCSSNSASPAVTETVYNEPVTPALSADEQYIDAVRSMDNWVVDYSSDSDLLNLGWETCGLLDQGYTVTDIAVYMVENGGQDMDYEFVGIVLGGAVTYLCPAYQYQLKDLVNS